MPQHAPVRRRTPTPYHHRRVSGPSRPRPVAAGVGIPSTGVFERIRAIPDKRVVDRLLRGRLCIWVIGVMLGGIVAMQVSLLRLNAGISRAVITASTLERQNSDMEASIAKLTAGDRVRAAAAAAGMIDPPAGEARWLTAHAASDPLRALKRMKPASDQAIAVMNNGGKPLGALAQTPATQLAGAAANTPIPTPTPAPTVVQSTATVVPTQTAVPDTGVTAAPQG